MDEIGRYTPRTARWVVSSIKQMQKRMAQFVTIKELYSLVGVAHDQNAIRVKNIDTQDAPAYGIMQIVDVENPSSGEKDSCYLHAQRPTDQYGRDGFYLVNGPNIIPAGEYGVAYDTAHATILAEGSGSAGDRYIPIVDEWKLDKDASGPYVLAGADDVDPDAYRFFRDPERTAWFLTSGSIPKKNAGVLGVASALLIKLSDSGGNVTFANSLNCAGAAISHNVYNASEKESVAAGEYIQCIQMNGKWVANWEEC